MEEITRPVVLEINLNNFEYNVNKIQEKVGKNVKIMPVIKANGYGTYINKRLYILNNFEIVAVATVDEAVFLRNIGYKKEIFILNQVYNGEIEKIIKYNFTIGISLVEFVKKLGEFPDNIKAHIEIETGMGRTGVNLNSIKEFIKEIPSNVKIEGIYTHFSSADTDDEFTKKQLEIFNKAVNEVTNLIGKVKYIHAAASNAILNYSCSYFNLVRPGIILYGYSASNDTVKKINLKPIATLKAKITFLKTVPKGTSISYGRSFITDKETKVATIPIGYADGFRREFSNCFEVLIKGKRVPIIGKICMDSFMVDVTKLNDVKVGDEVIIWDNNNITLEDLADKCNTINYEILCTISDRVPRKFIRE